MIYTEERQLKDKKLDNAIEVLKTEFVGIDEQIEGILNNMRTWYLYPELQSRPLVISLWGLTGVGKTCVVKRIAELLDIEKDLVYFNFAEIGEWSSWEIENKLEEELSNDKSNRMFVYDEFQYAATLNAMGEEKEKKNGLKAFWELLDSGKIHKRDNFYAVRQLHQLLRYIFKINDYKPMEIKNGQWVNASECLRGFNQYERSKFQSAFRWDNESDCDKKQEDDEYTQNPRVQENSEFFIKESYVEKLSALCDMNEHKTSDEIDFYRKLCQMDIDQIIGVIDNACERASCGYDLDFKDSIIFVIGNLDEAYQMALDVDPDMSPDQFHKATKNITIVDIKKSLQKRFRNEQIARLGNIHMIYPSFSSKSFRDIIKLTLDRYGKDVKRLTGYNLTYDESLVEIIYKDAVFPTHGTRPIFSSIHEIVKTKFPTIIYDVANLDEDVDKTELTINYSYKNRRMLVTVVDTNDKVIYSKKFKLNLRVESLRENTKDENQCLVATHESGHFVMYAKLFEQMPEKLCSKSADSGTGGFMARNVDDEELDSRKVLLNHIKVMLGGYMAEKFVFGVNNITAGSENDLKRATTLASRIVREYGMCPELGCGITTYIDSDGGLNNEGNLILDDDLKTTNSYINDIIYQCAKEVNETFRNEHWKKMLKDSALYLSKHSTMPKHKMKELYNSVPKEVRKTDKNDNFYRDTLKNL